MVDRKSAILASVTCLGMVVLGLRTMGLAAEPAGSLRHLRQKWVGEYPTQGHESFVAQPEIKTVLEGLLGEDRIKGIVSGEYLEVPIDWVDQYFILEYPADGHVRKEETIYLIIRENSGAVHAAIKDENGSITWKHSQKDPVPVKILRMLDLKR